MLKYRSDIDGLRAIAVGSVVLYHLSESVVRGGFVGVDIFFVISGYLITKLIYSELSQTGAFSFGNFYLRRVRRLFPALFVTLLLCIVFSYQLFSPTHLVEFGQSLIASILSVSNFFFWSIAGYFDSDSSLKPLLHTWSLSVEEQFYLIWPAVLVGLFSFKKGWVIPVFILGMGAVSLLFNHLFFSEQMLITSWFETQDNQSSLDIHSTAFYLLPFRIFEFSIGAILVWTGALEAADRKSNRWLNELCFITGLVMIVTSMLTYTSEMDFPSSAALLPCVGAALMIYSGPEHRLVWIVSNRLMVGLGLISYSLYLIHWPLIVFYKYWSGQVVNLASGSALIIISMLLAYMMYRFIEQPFRKPKRKVEGQPPNKHFLVGALISTILVVILSANVAMSGGWLWRFPSEVLAQLKYKKGDYTEYFWKNIKKLSVGFKNDGKPKVLVIGDSMAADFLNVLIEAGSDQEIDLAAISVGENCKGMFPLTDRQYEVIYQGARDICRREHEKIMGKGELFEAADTIILASYWWEIHHLKYLVSTARYLKTVSDAKVMVLGIKVQRNNGIWFLTKNAFSPRISKLRTPPHNKVVEVNNVLKSQAQDYQYFDLLGLFCNVEGCQRVTKDRYVIVFDDSHLSENGARYLSRGIRQTDWYKKLLETR